MYFLYNIYKMTECIICLDDIGNDDEYAMIHNVGEKNIYHPKCLQTWTEHSLIGIITREPIKHYSIFKNEQHINTITIKDDQPRKLVDDEPTLWEFFRDVTFFEILFNEDDDSFDLDNFGDGILANETENDIEPVSQPIGEPIINIICCNIF